MYNPWTYHRWHLVVSLCVCRTVYRTLDWPPHSMTLHPAPSVQLTGHSAEESQQNLWTQRKQTTVTTCHCSCFHYGHVFYQRLLNPPGWCPSPWGVTGGSALGGVVVTGVPSSLSEPSVHAGAEHSPSSRPTESLRRLWCETVLFFKVKLFGEMFSSKC